LFLQIGNSVGTLCGMNVLKKYVGMALGGVMGMAWWDVIGHHTIYP